MPPHPKKHLGQHFLHDQAIIQRIIQAISPQPDDYLIEIGPGRGALTQHLLNNVNQLHAIEIDRDAIELLTQNCASPKLIIHHTDVLKFDFTAIAKKKLRVVGNLPYNISTPLLFHLLKQIGIIHDMIFMLQQEVAERIVANPRNKQYGRLSVMLQYYCDAKLLFRVKPAAFFPAPQVNSAVIRLIPHSPAIVAANPETLADVVKQAFGQRRKTIHNSLKKLINTEALIMLGINPNQRAEELTVIDFVKITNAIVAAIER